LCSSVFVLVFVFVLVSITSRCSSVCADLVLVQLRDEMAAVERACQSRVAIAAAAHSAELDKAKASHNAEIAKLRQDTTLFMI
jgi:hypothetical protein